LPLPLFNEKRLGPAFLKIAGFFENAIIEK
jgi:hypothetical protein